MSLKDLRVLYISYNGMLDPLGQSQVIPYLRELSREGVRFTLLSFERAAAFEPEGIKRCERLKQQLAAHNIEWHFLRYHSRPSLPATAYDVLAGTRYASRLVREQGISLVHARNYIPATIALLLKKRFGVKMIFDVRGLQAEEYIDAGHWREGSTPVRITKMAERRTLRAADGIVTLTERIWPIIKEWDALRTRTPAHVVVPCCADLEKFKFDPDARRTRRAELGLTDSFVVVYSGSIGSWYMTEEMAAFFAVLMRERPRAHFLWLTSTAGHDAVRRLMREHNIEKEHYTVRAVLSEEVPSYLSASDAGIAFIKPCFSKLASSPTKTAEYLACGLPLILNAGVGDSDSLITTEKVGALVEEFTEEEYRKAAATISRFNEDAPATRRHTRSVAERLFDVRSLGLARYRLLYEEVCARHGEEQVQGAQVLKA